MDNLEILKQNLDIAIDPNAGVGGILAQEHNDMVTEFISKQGKYVGSPFNAKANYNGVANAGDFFINGALNDVNGISIITAKMTNDLNDFGIVLKTLISGDIIHFKDFVGRSCYFTFNSYLSNIDNNGSQIYQINVTPSSNNINYTYQPNDVYICVISIVKNNVDYFKDVELNLFWEKRKKDDNLALFRKLFDYKKLISTDINGTRNKLTIPTNVLFLGIEFNKYFELQNFNPQIIIERYKYPKNNKTIDKDGVQHGHYSPAKYRITYPYSDYIEVYGLGQIFRPQIIPLTGKIEYYDIYAENYFQKENTPNPYCVKTLKTYNKTNLNIFDDTGVFSGSFPRIQKGYVHCRLRLQITVDGKEMISNPLCNFKIQNILEFPSDYVHGSPIKSLVKYSF